VITAALIGLGNIAWKYDARNQNAGFALSQGGAMRAHPDIVLAGGCSPDATDRAGFTQWSEGSPAFAAPDEMLQALRPELVGICSPTELHFSHAKLCLESGVRLLWLEKPPATTAAELLELTALAAHKQATVCVNYFRRYLPVYQRLRDALRTELFGPCRLLRILYSPGLVRSGAQLLDQLFFLTGAEGYELLWVEQGTSDNPSFVLRLSTGQLVQAAGSDLAYHSNDLSAVCPGGVLSVLRGGKRVMVECRIENALFPGFYDLQDSDHAVLGDASLEGYMENALTDLLAASRAHAAPQSDLRSARYAQALLEDILGGSRI
jgi:predicted dehydrogenase